MSTQFNRGNFTELWIKLTSDEPLGPLNGDYLEDYYGNRGFITLHHVDTAQDFQLAMLAVPEETPSIPNDVFQGVYSPLSDLPDGTYQLRFRCKDPWENYTISHSVQNPFGDERVLELSLMLVTAETVTVIGIGIIARLGMQFHVNRNLVAQAQRRANTFYARRQGIQT